MCQLLNPTSEFSLISSKLVFVPSLDEAPYNGENGGESKNNRMGKLKKTKGNK